MGCASSKIETEEAVKRCKARKQCIKRAVRHRHEFAAAHASYAQSLKNTGAAIRQLADVEAIPEGASQPTRASLAVRPSVSILPPPQPPEDTFSVPRTPLPRAASMPPIALKSQSGSPSRGFLGGHPQDLNEDTEDLFEDQGFSVHKPSHSETMYDPFDNISGPGTSTFDTEELERKGAEAEDEEVEDEHYHAPIPQVKSNNVKDMASYPIETKKQVQLPPVQQKTMKSDLSFGAILRSLDDHFLKSYEAAGDVSRLLEAKRDYHYVPFVDEKSGIKEHNKKVSHILAWTQSTTESSLANDETDINKLASTLDSLHAWEKKLYDEVKAAEATRLELERRSAQLKNLREGQEASASIQKTRAYVKSLNTRYLVEIEAMDAAVLEVKQLRDKSLYPQLVDLLKALKMMWKVMSTCHQSQVPLVEELSKLDTPSTKETGEYCKKMAEDLEREVRMWHDNLEDMVQFQEKCVMALLDWSLSNARQLESEADDHLPASLKDDTPLCDLCQTWADVVKKLSADTVLQHLKQFSSRLQDVAREHDHEIKQKKRKEDMFKELERKKKNFEAFESKYKEKAGSKGSQEYTRHPIQERRALVELLEKNVAEEEHRHAEMCEKNSTRIFQIVKEGLPDVVLSIRNFSVSCAEEYEKLL